MKNRVIATMAADDPRQYMLNENFEVYEKVGIPSGAMEIHFHNFYEIMYIMEGEFSILLDNTTYKLKQGDVLLIDINHLHRYQYAEKNHDHNKRTILWISKTFLNEISQGISDLSACFSLPDTSAFHFPAHYRSQFETYLTELLFLYADTTADRPENLLLSQAYLTLFFVYLNKLCLRREFYFNQKDTYHDPIIHAISQFVEEHILESISLDLLAEHVHLSKYHLVRIFKAATGMTIHTFITQKRLITACEMIWNGIPLTELYTQCGFQNYSSFFRSFKAVYGLSPQEYKSFFEANHPPD